MEQCSGTVFVCRSTPNKRLAEKNSLKAKKAEFQNCHFDANVKLNFYQIFENMYS